MRLTATLFLGLLICASAFGQRRPVSVVHDHVMYNYTVIRYVPVWDIRSGATEDGLLSKHR